MRNKIDILREILDFNEKTSKIIDVGNILSNAYNQNQSIFLDESRMDSSSFFSKLILEQLSPNTKEIIFCNIGILQEPDFDLNVSKFFLDFATSYRVCIYWPYQVVDNRKLIFSQEFASEAIVFNPNTLEMESLWSILAS